MFEIELIISIKMDLALKYLQRLIYHKTQITNQPNVVSFGNVSHNSNRNTYIIQTDSFVLDTNKFINFWLRSMATQGISWCLRSLSVEICKTRPHLNDGKLNWRLFKILRFSGPSLLGMTSSTLQSHFLSGGLLWQMATIISFLRERKTAPNDYAPGLKDSNRSKSCQTEWYNIINEKWLI